MTRFSVISDLHYSLLPNHNCPARCGTRAIHLLLKAVEQLNTDIHPDLLVLCGDLVNDPADVNLLRDFLPVLQQLQCPLLAIPGNHDPKTELFYSVIPKPPPCLDIGGIRFLPFPDDPETPHWNSFRPPETNAELMQNSPFPVVLVQHVPLFHKNTPLVTSFYNYDNADEIVDFAVRHNAVLSVSGHFHFGYPPSRTSCLPSFAAPALCEQPFSFVTAELDNSGNLLSFLTSYLPDSYHE